MCLHGLAQSGQEQRVRMSSWSAGNRLTPAAANTSSICSGISPLSSRAAYSAWLAIWSTTRCHSASLRRWKRIDTSYGLGRLPCTRACTPSAPTSSEVTWPARAYARPRASRAGLTRRSRAATQRLAHQFLPNVPRRVRARIPCDGSRGPCRSHQAWLLATLVVLRHLVLAPQPEQVPELVSAELGNPGLAGADDRLRKLDLALDQPVQRLFEGPGAHVLVDLDVPRLPDPEGAIGGLVLDGRVPPAVEVKHVVRPGQVQAGPAGLQRQHEHWRAGRLGLEGRDDKGALILGDDLVKHLAQAGQLTAAAGQRAGVVQQKRRMVAHLLELGQ